MAKSLNNEAEVTTIESLLDRAERDAFVADYRLLRTEHRTREEALSELDDELPREVQEKLADLVDEQLALPNAGLSERANYHPL